MAILAQGSFIDVTLSGESTLTLQNPGGFARVEFPAGTTVWSGSGANVQLDLNNGTARIYAIVLPLMYFASPDPVATASPANIAALAAAPLSQAGSTLAVLNATKTALRDPAGGADIVLGSSTALQAVQSGAGLSITLDGNGRMATMTNAVTGRVASFIYADATHLTVQDNQTAQAVGTIVLDSNGKLVSYSGNFP